MPRIKRARNNRHRPLKMIWEDQDREFVAATSPSCQELGIPNIDHSKSILKISYINGSSQITEDIQTSERVLTLPCGTAFIMDKLLYPNEQVKQYYLPMIATAPLHFNEVGNVRRRNERERERVRCVNEGYARLRRHLPVGENDKRISKVETLRYAIDYIKYLESMLSDIENDSNVKEK